MHGVIIRFHRFLLANNIPVKVEYHLLFLLG